MAPAIRGHALLAPIGCYFKSWLLFVCIRKIDIPNINNHFKFNPYK